MQLLLVHLDSHSIHSTDSQATPLTPVEEQRQTYNNDPGNKADLESESSNRTDGTAPSSVRSRKKSRASSRALSPPKPIGAGPLTTMGKGDASSGEEEMAAIGRVSFSVYKDYFRATGWAFFWSFIVFIVANTVANTLNSFWLSNWWGDQSFESFHLPFPYLLGPMTIHSLPTRPALDNYLWPPNLYLFHSVYPSTH